MSSYPLLFHSSPDRTIAWRDGAPVSVHAFLADVARVAAALPAGGHVFNVCADRYRFAVSLCATLVAGKVSLLPSTHTPEMVRQLASFAPDAFCLHDAADCAIELPRFRYPDAPCSTADAGADRSVPMIDGARVMAYVFTSGSVGTPVPHRKTWGFLVRNVRAAAGRLGLLGTQGAPAREAPTLVGTVPPQHMYGFESTVLLALIGGLAFSNRQPFYPADVRAELDALPQPRVLVTTPVHLRALLASAQALPRASLVLSATAPLARQLADETEARLGAPLLEIYGSTETGQIATRRTARGDAWQLLADVRLERRASAGDDDGGATVWAFGGHVEEPVPMGDALELLDDEHFLLHGRLADLVNIAGKRTSLGYLNHQLNAIEGVEDGVFYMPDDAPVRAAGVPEIAATHGGGRPVARLGALVVAPRLTAAELVRALRERIDAAFLPRPLRFVDALPRNATGKLPREVLAALVEQGSREAAGAVGAVGAREAAALREARPSYEVAPTHEATPSHQATPLYEATPSHEAISPHEAARSPQAPLAQPDAASPSQQEPQPHAASRPTPLRFAFAISPDHPALPGHFPGHPVVPGVVLLDHAIGAIGAALDRSFDACRLGSAKFPSPAAPGEPLELAFETTASGAVRFSVSAGPREVASGVLSAPPDARHGATARAPAAHRPTAQGPAAQGPTAHGPAAQGPAAQGSAAQGPAAQASTNDPGRRWI